MLCLRPDKSIDARSIPDEEKHENIFTERVYSENESAVTQEKEKVKESMDDFSVRVSSDDDRAVSSDAEDEFDLSDISARPQSREDIIAAAEREAFKE